MIECRFKSGSRYQIFRLIQTAKFEKFLSILPLADDVVLGSILRVRRLSSVMVRSAGLGFSIVRFSERRGRHFHPGKLSGTLDALDDSTPGHVGRGGLGGRRVVGCVERGLRVETALFRPSTAACGQPLRFSKIVRRNCPLIEHAHMGELSSRVLLN